MFKNGVIKMSRYKKVVNDLWLGGNSKYLMLVFLTLMDDEGKVRFSREALEELTALDVHTIHRVVTALIKRDYLTVEREGSRNVYCLNMGRLK